MPCWDSLLYKEASKPYGDVKFQEESPKIYHLESRIHNLTEMLCGLCKQVELSEPSVFLENTKLSAWWKDHKAHDEAIEEIKEIKEIEEIRSMRKQLDDLEQRVFLMQAYKIKIWNE